MSFQGYLNTIKEKTGKGPDDFRKLANQKGFSEKGILKPTTKAGEIIQWLKEDFPSLRNWVLAQRSNLPGGT